MTEFDIIWKSGEDQIRRTVVREIVPGPGDLVVCQSIVLRVIHRVSFAERVVVLCAAVEDAIASATLSVRPESSSVWVMELCDLFESLLTDIQNNNDVLSSVSWDALASHWRQKER